MESEAKPGRQPWILQIRDRDAQAMGVGVCVSWCACVTAGVLRPWRVTGPRGTQPPTCS